MEVGIRYEVCKNIPAELVSLENVWSCCFLLDCTFTRKGNVGVAFRFYWSMCVNACGWNLIADLGASSDNFFWWKEGMMGKGCLVNILPCVSRYWSSVGENQGCFYSSTFISICKGTCVVLAWFACCKSHLLLFRLRYVWSGVASRCTWHDRIVSVLETNNTTRPMKQLHTQWTKWKTYPYPQQAP